MPPETTASAQTFPAQTPASARTLIATHNVVHLRRDPNNNSERVSQTLMGRTVHALRAEGAWTYVETDDTYRGWVESRWLAEAQKLPLTFITSLFADVRESPRREAPLLMRLSVLSALHVTPPRSFKEEWVAVTLPDGETHGWMAAAAVAPPTIARVPPEMMGRQAALHAREFMGTPYLWGGSSSYGLDCSGFVQLCYRLVGLNLRRDADIQRSDERFAPVEQTDLQPGDLAFFGKPDKITHVGMHWGGNHFIHAAGGAGVILTEWGDERYSPGFVDARRLDPARAAWPIQRFEAEDR